MNKFQFDKQANIKRSVPSNQHEQRLQTWLVAHTPLTNTRQATIVLVVLAVATFAAALYNADLLPTNQPSAELYNDRTTDESYY